ncbi:TetR/AcrR family transcriptional regulator [Comamonas guangdongensis]|uniref:TetR/AcrR family transcriptional regulator n=1 Tax=Comamonas guangdongensis TaxID=510515 RepID=A0ABV3ZY46_9BURK
MSTETSPRKQLILEVAERHFAEHGFAGGSLSAIARECELGNPGLLHHFPSKERLYRAVLELQARELTARMQALLSGTDSPAERLQGFVALQLDWMRSRPTGARLIARELLDNGERIAAAQARPLEAFLNAGLALITEAQQAGLVRGDVNVLSLLTMVLGSLSYAQMARPTLHKAFGTAALNQEAPWMQAVATDMLRLLAPEPASSA